MGRYAAVIYPAAELGGLVGSTYHGHATSQAAATKRAEENAKRLADDGLDCVKSVVVELDGDAIAAVLDEGGKRVKNPGGKRAKRPNPPKDWAKQWGATVWKSAPSEKPREEALVGILKAADLERKQVSRAVRDVYPPKKKKVDADARTKRLKGRVARQFDAVADERPELRSWSLAARDTIVDAVADELDPSKSVKRAEIEALIVTALDEAEIARSALDEVVNRADVATAAAAVKQIRQAAPNDADTAYLEQRLAEVRACPAPVPGEPPRVPPRVVVESWGKVVYGAPTVVYYPDSRLEAGLAGLGELRAHYALVDAASIIPSHDPHTFSPHPQYPAELQERDYQRDVGEQQKVIRQAEKLQPELVINTNPDAVSGPPILASDGVVLGGNSRAMAIQRAVAGKQRGRRERYYNTLLDELTDCGSYGLDGAAALAAFKNPVLVRVIDKDQEIEAARVSRDLNRALTQALSPAAEAVSLGRMLPKALFELLGDDLATVTPSGKEYTLAQVIDRNAKKILDLLQQGGVVTNQNMGEFVKYRSGRPTDELSSDGRAAIRRAVVGAMVGDKEVMALASARTEAFWERIAPLVLGTRDLEGDWDLTGPMRAACRAVAIYPSSNLATFQANFHTGSLAFDDASRARPEDLTPELFADPLVAILACWLAEAQTTPRKGFDAMRSLAKHAPRARGQVGLDIEGGPSFEDRFAQFLSPWPSIAATREEVEAVGVGRWLAGQRTPAPKSEPAQPELTPPKKPDETAEAEKSAFTPESAEKSAPTPESGAKPTTAEVKRRGVLEALQPFDPKAAEDKIVAAWQDGNGRAMLAAVEEAHQWNVAREPGEPIQMDWPKWARSIDRAQAWIDEHRDIAEAMVLDDRKETPKTAAPSAETEEAPAESLSAGDEIFIDGSAGVVLGTAKTKNSVVLSVDHEGETTEYDLDPSEVVERARRAPRAHPEGVRSEPPKPPKPPLALSPAQQSIVDLDEQGRRLVLESMDLIPRSHRELIQRPGRADVIGIYKKRTPIGQTRIRVVCGSRAVKQDPGRPPSGTHYYHWAFNVDEEGNITSASDARNHVGAGETVVFEPKVTATPHGVTLPAAEGATPKAPLWTPAEAKRVLAVARETPPTGSSAADRAKRDEIAEAVKLIQAKAAGIVPGSSISDAEAIVWDWAHDNTPASFDKYRPKATTPARPKPAAKAKPAADLSKRGETVTLTVYRKNASPERKKAAKHFVETYLIDRLAMGDQTQQSLGRLIRRGLDKDWKTITIPVRALGSKHFTLTQLQNAIVAGANSVSDDVGIAKAERRRLSKAERNKLTADDRKFMREEMKALNAADDVGMTLGTQAAKLLDQESRRAQSDLIDLRAEEYARIHAPEDRQKAIDAYKFHRRKIARLTLEQLNTLEARYDETGWPKGDWGYPAAVADAIAEKSGQPYLGPHERAPVPPQKKERKAKAGDAEFQAIFDRAVSGYERYMGPDKARKAFREAVSLGVGKEFATWARKNQKFSRSVEPTYHLAHARAVLALQKGEPWPPPPLRGDKYGREEFKGILASLDDSPMVDKMAGWIGDWSARAKVAIPDFQYVVGNTTIPTSVGGFESAVLDVTRLDAMREALHPTPRTRETLNKARAVLEKRIKDWKLALHTLADADLYNGKAPAETVARALCDVDSDIAGRVLEKYHDLDLGWGQTRRRAIADLCTTNQQFQKSVAEVRKAADERELVRKKAKRESDANFKKDAEALVGIIEAVKTRPLTTRKLNMAYWRIHGELSKWARDERRFTIKQQGARRIASVRGPRNYGFSAAVTTTSDAEPLDKLIAKIYARAGKERPAAKSYRDREREQAGRRKNPGGFDFKDRVAQQLKLPKSKFTAEEAIDWAADHGAPPIRGEQSANYWVLILAESSGLDDWQTMTLPNGVLVVFGTPKRKSNPVGAVALATLVASVAGAADAARELAR